MLQISFLQVKNSQDPLTNLDRQIKLTDDFFTRGKEIIKSAGKVHVRANFFFNDPFVEGDYHIKANVIVPSTRSLKDVYLHQDFHFSEQYSENPVRKQDFDKEETIVMTKKGQIDVQKAVEDNLLLSIPTVVLTPEERSKNLYPQGQGWAVVSEDQLSRSKDKSVNPVFAKLKKEWESKNK